ncbi:NAD(+)/NADH kinase [Aquimarina sediminis]|uniref:NAD(+)/NADH kinase n=1 Tax=Aquimarina sediminis TaxID=2070536 RepID=UPI000CA02E38|nr:NAD(+)/NADH kinase [Aquimarina sediminis]
MEFDKIIIVRDKTRLEQLIERFNSKSQAKFYLERSGGDIGFYELEHETFYKSLRKVEMDISGFIKYKTIHRSFLPSYIFTQGDLILVIGQDGLVANTAKYVKGQPIIAINPDQYRYDGILLLHTPNTFLDIVKSYCKGKNTTKKVTMAKVKLNDGQELLAFNDFYIGAATHISSRYSIEYNGIKENQSSSGVLVSTGAGSTGWLSSIFNMNNNINTYTGQLSKKHEVSLNWEDDKLLFVVREPFLSKMSEINLGFGIIKKEDTLLIESSMPTNGVIFSDGIESDFLNFNSGSICQISIAHEKANLVV